MTNEVYAHHITVFSYLVRCRNEMVTKPPQYPLLFCVHVKLVSTLVCSLITSIALILVKELVKRNEGPHIKPLLIPSYSSLKVSTRRRIERRCDNEHSFMWNVILSKGAMEGGSWIERKRETEEHRTLSKTTLEMKKIEGRDSRNDHDAVLRWEILSGWNRERERRRRSTRSIGGK